VVKGKAAVCVLASIQASTHTGSADVPGNAPASATTLNAACKMVKSTYFQTAPVSADGRLAHQAPPPLVHTLC